MKISADLNYSYRVGLPGFLASQELLNSGIKTNNGLRDQRIALSWIRSYIEGFGGDPNNITVVGVSVGASEYLIRPDSMQLKTKAEDRSFLLPSSRVRTTTFQ